jgi:hypothetical protein
MSAVLSQESAGKASLKILGSPNFLMSVPHPDDVLPFIEVGFTVDGPYPTVLVQNVRVPGGHWQQTPIDIATRISLATLCAVVAAVDDEGSSAEDNVHRVISRAVSAIPAQHLELLGRAVSQAAIAAMKRGNARNG